MRSTGIVRKVDEVGRLVLPSELRRTHGLNEGTAVEIFVDGEAVMLRRYEPLCVFCGGGDELRFHHGKRICSTCRQTVSTPAG